MRIIRTVDDMFSLALKIRRAGKVIGFVPTMGYLHEGHLSLIRIARPKCDILVVSIFVNPTQFAPEEDLNEYPRDIERDESLCEKEGVDILFYPTKEEMYPNGFRTEVKVKGLSEILCGESRPIHFAGVTTVVAKLFNIVKPDITVFGQKDAQQAVIIKRMVEDLNFGVDIIVGPIIREEDGLAMSSRNKYLTPEQRKAAPVLYKSLLVAKNEIESGRMKSLSDVVEMIRRKINNAGDFEIDYIAIVDPVNLEPVEKIAENEVLILIAAKIGQTRLIDNILVSPAN